MLLWKGVSLHAVLAVPEMLKTEAGTGCLSKKVSSCVEAFAEMCGPQRRVQSPQVGCNFQKLHGLFHFADQMKLFGSAEKISIQCLESHLKSFIKHPAKRTRKTHADFSHDLINRWSEHASVADCILCLAISSDGCDGSANEEDDAKLSKNVHLGRPAFSFLKKTSLENLCWIQTKNRWS